MDKIGKWLQVLFLVWAPLGGIACGEKAPPAGEKKPPLLLAGAIDLDPELQKTVDPLAVIFVILRTPEGQIGAVKKLLPPFQYPLPFELTSENLMIPGMKLTGAILPSARLDRDGDANPAQAGDILGQSEPKTAELGSKDVRIILKEVVK